MIEDKMLSAEKLSAGYVSKGSHPVLEDVTIDVRKGEMVGIIGPNGAGKSTLLRTLRGLIPRISGRIAIMGRDVDDLTSRVFAQYVSYLSQQSGTDFGYDAMSVVMTGRYPYLSWWQSEGDEDRRIVRACMAYTGVETLAYRPIAELSGGQRQRVLLAKVLAQQTPILFLDEPATGLDLIYQEEIFRFCRELCAAGKTVLMVVHELALAARFCSRLLLIGDGRVIADGSPDEVLTEGLLERAYGMPIKVVKNPVTGHDDIFTEKNHTESRHEALLDTILGVRA